MIQRTYTYTLIGDTLSDVLLQKQNIEDIIKEGEREYNHISKLKELSNTILSVNQIKQMDGTGDNYAKVAIRYNTKKQHEELKTLLIKNFKPTNLYKHWFGAGYFIIFSNNNFSDSIGERNCPILTIKQFKVLK